MSALTLRIDGAYSKTSYQWYVLCSRVSIRIECLNACSWMDAEASERILQALKSKDERRRRAILTTSPRLSNGRWRTSTDMAPDGRHTVARSPGNAQQQQQRRRRDEAAVGALKRESVNDWRRARCWHGPLRRAGVTGNSSFVSS